MRPNTLLLILIAMLGMMHIWIRTSTYGAALDPDSLVYLFAAENFALGNGAINYRADPINSFPPFFPMLLGFISLFGIEPVDAGRFVNIAAFGLIILISGLYLGRNLRSHLLALGVAVAIMADFYLSSLCSYVLTETLFILLLLLALMPLGSVPDRRSEKRALVLSAIFAALAPVTRYIGVTVIFAAVLVISMRRGKPVYAKLKDALIYAVFSSIPIILLLAYNWTVYNNINTLVGSMNRSAIASGQSIFESLEQIVWGAGRRIVPPPLGIDYLVYTVLGAVSLIGVSVVAFAIISRRGQAMAPSEILGPFLPFGIFVPVYLVVLAIVAPYTTFPIHARFLVPCVVPALLVGTFFFDLFLHSEVRGKMAAVKWVVATFILIGCVANVGFQGQRNLAATIEYYPRYEDPHLKSYNTAHYADLELGEYLRTHPIDGRVYTNIPGLVWWLADVSPPIRWVRGNANDCLAWLQLALAQFQQRQESEEVYIVYIELREDVEYYCHIPESELPTQLERVASFSDGAVYRVVVLDEVAQ